MVTEWTAVKTEKRTIAPENKNLMISFEREESWLTLGVEHSASG